MRTFELVSDARSAQDTVEHARYGFALDRDIGRDVGVHLVVVDEEVISLFLNLVEHSVQLAVGDIEVHLGTLGIRTLCAGEKYADSQGGSVKPQTLE